MKSEIIFQLWSRSHNPCNVIFSLISKLAPFSTTQIWQWFEDNLKAVLSHNIGITSEMIEELLPDDNWQQDFQGELCRPLPIAK
jgi:hypothetical protein